jgi:hypothetical protein
MLSYNAKDQTTSLVYGSQVISSLAYTDVDQTERTQAEATSFASGPWACR